MTEKEMSAEELKAEILYEEPWLDDEEEDEEDYEEEDEFSPETCTFGGIFQPGVEDCEFCEWRDGCEKSFIEWAKKEGVFK